MAYHVFLSFRGEDTGKTFTDHLYTALVQAGFRTFRDDDDTDRENSIKNVIQQSMISIIVFSKDYASSKWCLDELVTILERRRISKHVVLPVFYDVDPSDVRKQTGSIAESFARYEEQLEGESNQQRKQDWLEKVKGWKGALREAADLSGMVLQNEADGHESKFIQKIVKEIESKLSRRSFLGVPPYLIGTNSRVKAVNSWLQDESNDAKIMVIYGIGGIGKTTIAKTVYNQNFDKFDGSSFLANVRDASEQHNGLVSLQRKLLSDILRGKRKKIYNVDEGITRIKDALCCKRILIVLDDVDDLDQLNTVLGMRDWFYPGSKIIITTRREKLLKPHYVCEVYNVKELDEAESLLLFSWHAFGQDHPTQGYIQVCQGVLQHCGGLPLAIKILGSSLSGRSVDIWESALKKLDAIPDNQVLKKLKISYDCLDDEHDKNLFLDIACFFVGEVKDYTITILDHCGYYTAFGIDNLFDRCLLQIGDKNRLMMHQLIRDMGREIIRQESPGEPGKRSRLWYNKDVLNVLREKTGTETVKGLILNLHGLNKENLAKKSPSENIAKNVMDFNDNSLKQRFVGLLSRLPVSPVLIESFSASNEDDLETDAFSGMQKLRLLQLNYTRVCGGYEKFPTTLRWLRWHGCHLPYIPINFHLENLVALDMCYSSLEHVWRGAKCLGLLKILNLSHSQALICSPDFSRVPNLETLILKNCVSLVEIHESIGNLKKLVLWNLKGCKNLRKLPKSIGMLKSLEKLVLIGCSKIDELTKEIGNMEALTVLHADGVNQFSYGEAKSQNAPKWSWLSKLLPGPKFPPASLPGSLVDLSLADCNLSNDSFLKDPGCLPLLQKLNLSTNPICSLSERIKDLSKLQSLRIVGCTELHSLPELPSSLKVLNGHNCTSLQRIRNLPNLLHSLALKLYNCEKLVEVQGLFKLEPIGNYDVEIINSLGLFNLEHIETLQVILWNNLAKTKWKGLVQGLYEFGIFNSFLPGSCVPDSFSNKNTGPAISFSVPSLPGLDIRGFSICVLYAGDVHNAEFYLKIFNKTKGKKFAYGPTFFGISESNKDMLWLSHWNFGNQLGVGDEIDVLVDANLVSFASDIIAADKVKECGIQFMYCEQKQVIQPNCTTYSSQQNVISGNLSAYETRKDSYFLSHHNFYLQQTEYKLDGWYTPGNAHDSIFLGMSEETRADWEGEQEHEEEPGAIEGDLTVARTRQKSFLFDML